MRLNRKTAPGFGNCKIKPVDPAFRSVSTPRQPKDLHVVGPVYREASIGRADGGLSASKRSTESLGVRLRERPKGGPEIASLPPGRAAVPVPRRGSDRSSRRSLELPSRRPEGRDSRPQAAPGGAAK